MAPEMAPKAKCSKNKFIFVFSAHKAFPTIYNMTILTKWQIFGAEPEMAPEMAPKAKFSKNKCIFIFSGHKSFPTIYNTNIL